MDPSPSRRIGWRRAWAWRPARCPVWCPALCLALAGVGCTGQIGEVASAGEPAPEDAPPDLEAPPPEVPLAPRMRLLEAREYAASVEALLGLEVSSGIQHGDRSNGYPTSARAQVDEALYTTLLGEAERLGEAYVAGPLTEDAPCMAGAPDGACVEGFARDLATRAWRRPVGDEELAGLRALWDRVHADASDPALATRALLTRVLMSAHFLHRFEVGTPAGDGERLLSPWEQASLIAYTLTGAPPDAPLLEAAADGLDEGERREHAERLLDSAAGRRTLARFVRFYLRADELERMAAQPGEYPKLASAAQGQDLLEELDRFVEAVVYEGDGTFQGLLTADRAPISAATAPLYEVDAEAVPEGDWGRHEFDPSRRRGVLGLASVLAAHGSANQAYEDSPVSRGLLLKNHFFCESIGLPSGIDVASAADMAGLDADALDELTVREQAEGLMNQGPACVECHAQFMPLGFAFGSFDALGRWQESRNGRPIDTSVDEVVVAERSRSYAGHLELIDALVEEPVVAACFARHAAAWVSGEVSAERLDTVARRALAEGNPEALDVRGLLVDMLAEPRTYLRAQDMGGEE